MQIFIYILAAFLQPPPQKMFGVFYVKEYILVHLSHRNIGNFLASSVPFLHPLL